MFDVTWVQEWIWRQLLRGQVPKADTHSAHYSVMFQATKVPKYGQEKCQKKSPEKEEVEVVTADGSASNADGAPPRAGGGLPSTVPTHRCGLENARSHDSESGHTTTLSARTILDAGKN